MAETTKIPRLNVDYSVSECFARFAKYELTAHWYHLNTNSFEEHKALNFITEKITKIKDKTLETLLGYAPKQNKCDINLNLMYSGKESAIQLCKDIWAFADEYEHIYEKINYGDLVNIFQEIKGIASQGKYLLTLS